MFAAILPMLMGLLGNKKDEESKIEAEQLNLNNSILSGNSYGGKDYTPIIVIIIVIIAIIGVIFLLKSK